MGVCIRGQKLVKVLVFFYNNTVLIKQISLFDNALFRTNAYSRTKVGETETTLKVPPPNIIKEYLPPSMNRVRMSTTLLYTVNSTRPCQ